MPGRIPPYVKVQISTYPDRIIPAGLESFVLNSDFGGFLVLQQARGRAWVDAEVSGGFFLSERP